MTKHISVFANRAIELLQIKENGIYIDGTLGRGGHSKLILDRLKKGKLYCFDLDNQAIEECKELLKDYDNVEFIHDNFANMNRYVDKVDGILLDLGVSSPQFDEAQRGFSYRFDGPLDMRMNLEDELSAYEVVNNYPSEKLIEILKEYGQERNAVRIAGSIIEKRPINTTFELVDAIKQALPAKVLSKKGHPAKQTFQAIRIEVNKELDSLKQFLNSFDDILDIDGNVVIITFHSLEDRLVKYRFKELSSIKDDLRIAKRPEEVEKARYRLLNHGDKPDKQEIESNHRASSAIIRGIKKIYG